MDVVQTIRTAPTRSEYLDYLNSPGWRSRRDRKLRATKWRCERCGAKRELQVHHLTYKRFRREYDDDLKVLCANCHRSEHLDRPDQTSLGLYLKLASEAVKANPWSTIADLSETVKRRCVELEVPLLPERIKSALAVVCGRLRGAPRSAALLDNLRPQNEFGGFSREEARDFFFRMDVALDGAWTEFIEQKSVPRFYKTADEQLVHEENLLQQSREIRRSLPPARKRSTMERLKEIFGESAGVAE